MLRIMPRVHYLHTDGTVPCKGQVLEDTARDTARSPPVITVHRCDVTCHGCLAWINRYDASGADA